MVEIIICGDVPDVGVLLTRLEDSQEQVDGLLLVCVYGIYVKYKANVAKPSRMSNKILGFNLILVYCLLIIDPV